MEEREIVKIELHLPDEALDAITERVIERLREQGTLNPAKEWLTVKEARELSGLSAHEIRKRIKLKGVKAHQPNPGKPPLLINRKSLLASME